MTNGSSTPTNVGSNEGLGCERWGWTPIGMVPDAHGEWVRAAPSLSHDDYTARAVPRLAAIDALAARIDFSSDSWRWTPEGERYQRLMDQQRNDEAAAGL